MSYDGQQGRFITVQVDSRTGTHQLLNWPTLPHSACIAICQGMGPVAQYKSRLIIRAHQDNPKD